MTIRNIVPRADDEGTIGTSAKRWSKGFFSDGIFYDATHGIRFSGEWQACNDGATWQSIGSASVVELTLSNSETIDPTAGTIFRVVGDAPGVIAEVADLSVGSAKEITFIGTSNTNYVIISGENLSLLGGGGSGFNIYRGDVLKLLWIDELSKWQETFSYIT